VFATRKHQKDQASALGCGALARKAPVRPLPRYPKIRTNADRTSAYCLATDPSYPGPEILESVAARMLDLLATTRVADQCTIVIRETVH
jgi:hypothetical protein